MSCGTRPSSDFPLTFSMKYQVDCIADSDLDGERQGEHSKAPHTRLLKQWKVLRVLGIYTHAQASPDFLFLSGSLMLMASTS
jgi:hypothetical protein